MAVNVDGDVRLAEKEVVVLSTAQSDRKEKALVESGCGGKQGVGKNVIVGRKKRQRSSNRLEEATAAVGGHYWERKEQLAGDQIRSRSSKEVGREAMTAAAGAIGSGGCDRSMAAVEGRRNRGGNVGADYALSRVGRKIAARFDGVEGEDQWIATAGGEGGDLLGNSFSSVRRGSRLCRSDDDEEGALEWDVTWARWDGKSRFAMVFCLCRKRHR
ncbi:hypothetical protein BHM03_00016184 [Ensete ventricosum]|nr:hypothetical protein BHM03_00016184 [Ensete ventricosum]